jgi:D-glucosaminate-6-phosphate ammonia-lyase
MELRIKMGIYEELGVTPIINLWGTATRLGGALLAPGVADAMVQASKESVKMDELQAAASRIIAEITGAEAGYVTCGAASGMTLGTAACLAGLDVARMERLPDTTGMPNEVMMARDQRCGYDHAIRAAGAKIVEVGLNESFTGSMRPVEAWEFELAITERTAAIAMVPYVWDPKKEPLMRSIIEVAKKHKIPILCDAAASVPPVENLRRFIAMGVDLVAFSGGKAIRGPQNAGILCGRRDLIASVALQHLDLGGYSDMWEPPRSLIPKESIVGQPHQGIGRSQKVGKEEIVGLLVRLRQLTKEKTLEEARYMQALLEQIASHIEGIPYLQTEIIHPASEGSGAMPTLKVKLDAAGSGQTARDVSLKLRNGNPRLWVNEKNLPDNVLNITAINLNEQLSSVVGKRLREVLTNGKH